MKTLELQKDLWYCGVQDPSLRTFDIIMHTEFGTSYNSYFIKGSEKTALIETAKASFFQEYLRSVQEVSGGAEHIDYLIMNHTEPDHAGSIEKLLDLNPNLKIVGTGTALTFLKHIVNRDFYSISVRDNDTLSLGDKTLHFMVLPNLHWPDTMYTCLEESRVLFTCDSFGSHFCPPDILRSTVTDEEGYLRATKYYFDNIIGPFKNPYMVNALKRIAPVDPTMICPGHGPVLDCKITELINLYSGWCWVQPNTKKTVVIPYVTAYGYTGTLAQEITKGIEAAGDIDVHVFNMAEADTGKVSNEILFADGILFGTPTIVGEALKPVWDLVTGMFSPVHKGKLASAFGSYGWSGEGVPNIIGRLNQLKLKVLDGLRVRFKPDENQLLDAYEFGYNFGCILLDKENDHLAPLPSGKVRCQVCGAIFDASLTSCPVCGVGPENFIPVEDDTPEETLDTNESFLVLGGGIGGVSAAEEIRKNNKTCTITLLTQEDYLPYHRPMLTKSMMAGFDPAQLAIYPKEWYQEQRIALHLSTQVTALHPKEKTVTCGDGTTYSYDKLIYALGSHAFVPPTPGTDLPGVSVIRTMEDAKNVKDQLAHVSRAVIIGGGVLGLEAAWELRKGKIQITVLESGDQIMKRQLDAGGAALIGEILSSNEITLLNNASVEAIEGTKKAEAVLLKDGTRIPADLVILSCGVRSNLSLMQDAGLEVGRAIAVDEHMATGLPDLWACGDCASYEGVNYGLWSQALEMGKIAGKCAAGRDASYVPVSGALNYNGLGTSIYAVGDNGKDPETLYQTITFQDTKRKEYRCYYFKNHRFAGAVLIGDTSQMAQVAKDLEAQTKLEEMKF